MNVVLCCQRGMMRWWVMLSSRSSRTTNINQRPYRSLFSQLRPLTRKRIHFSHISVHSVNSCLLRCRNCYYYYVLLNAKINVTLSENASRTRYTVKIKLKLRKWVLEKKVFSCLLKDGSELAEVTTGGRLFHMRAAATPNARLPRWIVWKLCALVIENGMGMG